MTAYAEKRRHERVATDIHVWWGQTYECPERGRVISLSVGGCFLRTDAAVPAGAEVFVNLWLPGSGPIPSEVRYRIEGYGLGVEFKLLGTLTAAQLANLVAFYSQSAAG
jgi:hypothetical protein